MCMLHKVPAIKEMPSTQHNALNGDNFHVEQFKLTTNSIGVRVLLNEGSEGKVVKLSLEVIIGS